jgi:PAS domain S-box-containing protein
VNLVATGYLVVAAACTMVAVEWLLLATQGPDRRTQLLFAGCSLAAAIDAFFVERRFVSLQSPEELAAILPWQTLTITSFLALLALFLAARTGVVRRWLLVTVLGLLFATTVLNFVLEDATYTAITSMREVTFPWGEVIHFGVGPAGPWRVVGDASLVSFLLLLLDTTIRLARSGQRRLAHWLGAGFLMLSLSALAIIPMDLGWWDVPPLHPFAFLLIVAFMSWELSSSVARSAELADEVVANERRWRQLVETAQLFVLRVAPDGRVLEVNPYFEELLGRSAAETVGKPLTELVAPEERSSVAESLSRLSEESMRGASRRTMIAADGERHFVEWRYVALHDGNGEFQGALSLGADVTERQLAQKDRDVALEELKSTVNELERLKERLEEENLVLREEIGKREGFEGLIGASDGLQYVLHKIEQVAGTEASVLIQGETGVGKELVARTIHEQSDRGSKPFVVMNCAALAPTLVDSELFGHERGAFTGADRRRQGRFELADGGTLFLDEVGELPLEVQPKLLRVLEQGDFRRVGGGNTIQVDVRLVAATNRDLSAEVAAGRFREDLYYRLEVYPITVPPLRERTEDIAPLVFHFLRRFNEKRKVRLEEVPPELIRRLEAYPWPGNVRELKNVLERAALASPERVLRLAEPLRVDNIRAAKLAPASVDGNGVLTLDELERRHIRVVLDLCHGQIAGSGGAAELLGLHANTLRSRMKKLGVVNKTAR